MDASGARLVSQPPHRFSEPAAARSLENEPRDDSAWRISVLSGLGPARSSEPAFGTMYSNNQEPPTPKEPQNMRLIIKKEGGAEETGASYKGQYRVRSFLYICVSVVYATLFSMDGVVQMVW